jgi:hypothetical protein
MALAPPLRADGALEISALEVGDWKNPNPAPQITIRTPISNALGWTGSSASETRPMPRFQAIRSIDD